MHDRRTKVFFFLLEGLNTLACSYYGNYLFFLLRDAYGFGNLQNLSVCAGHGLIFAVSAWQGGRFAQRFGYFTALQTGFAIMAVCLIAGALLPSLPAQLGVLAGWTVGMCFTWPALEALVSEGESDEDLPQIIGLYNFVWSGAAALTYFLGGAIFDHLGRQSLYWLPVIILAVEALVVAWLSRRVGPTMPRPALAHVFGHTPEPEAFRQPVSPKTFLRMAWLANPFAYMGINTLLAIVPGLAGELHLSVTLSGLFCSVWFFARLGTFALLWRWTGWHYRFRWLLAAFLGLIASLATLLVVREFWMLVCAQLVFGVSVGLIYYSSLFYSMDVGETKGEHGGLHEAAIGVGICIGPAVGAAGLLLAPQVANAGAYAVSALLAMGLAGLIALRLRRAP